MNIKNLYFFPILSLLFAIGASLLNTLSPIHRIAIIFFSCCIYACLLRNSSIKLSFITMLISFALNYSILLLIGIPVCFILFIFFNSYETFPHSYVHLPVGILQVMCVHFIFCSKRIINGIRFLSQKVSIHIGILFSSMLLIYIANISSSTNLSANLFQRSVAVIGFILFSLFIPFYWRHRITQTYREKLRLANEKSLEDELNKQKETIANLEADNARLSQIVHKDNKIILAMLTAVTEHLENATNATPDEQIIRGNELSAQLHDMANERQGILNTQSKLPNTHPKSGLHTVDGMLSFMETRAKEAGITYKLQLEENIKELVSNSIEEADLLHMLGDLIENSLIATKHTNNEKEILIHLGSLQGHFLLEISDSGIPFSLETYQRFGNEQHTTHSEDGGSGIGLMDIWKLKKKYKASLHIYEYEDSEGIYTKKLAFIFDRKNHFLLQTPRYKEATYALTRGDLYIFSNKEE